MGSGNYSFWKANKTITTIDPTSGKPITQNVQGGFAGSDAQAAIGTGVGALMDGYNIYMTYKNYKLNKAKLDAQKEQFAKEYGLAKAAYDDKQADKRARAAAVQRAGIGQKNKTV